VETSNKSKIIFASLGMLFLLTFLALPASTLAASLTVQNIADEFKTVYGRVPTNLELDYWKSRRVDKKTSEAIMGAMYSAKAEEIAATSGGVVKATGKDLAKYVTQAFREVYGRLPKADEKAWWAARAVCGSFAKYADMIGSMKYHKANKVTKGAGGKEQFCAPKSTSEGVGGLNAKLGISGNKSGPMVKVGVWLSNKFVTIGSSNKFVFQYSGGKKIFNSGETAKVSLSGGDYVVSGPKGFKKNVDQAPKFTPASGAIMEVVNYSDTGSSGTNYNRFRGNIIVQRDSAGRGLWAINELRTEDYVKGLAETSDNAPEAFQKALAIAARTYVLNHTTLGGRQPQNGFDITNTPNDQWYRGYNYELVTPGFSNSVKSTAGQVITYGEKLIAALYFSGSDGRTRSAQEVWHSSKFPYLQSKPDPYGGKTLRGHGVGMSGDGAVNYARKEGWDYKKILHYYYTNVKIERGY
jgi:hypothetical protein